MTRFSRIEVALKMKETGMVPVSFHSDIEICKKVVKACYAPTQFSIGLRLL